MSRLIQDTDTPEQIIEKLKLFDTLNRSIWQPIEIKPKKGRRRRIPIIVCRYSEAHLVLYDAKTETVINHQANIDEKLTDFQWWCFVPLCIRY